MILRVRFTWVKRWYGEWNGRMRKKLSGPGFGLLRRLPRVQSLCAARLKAGAKGPGCACKTRKRNATYLLVLMARVGARTERQLEGDLYGILDASRVPECACT
jgi:hypothetical protein